MTFERLILNEWKQFNEIEIIFHPRVTILTGANGAGKTTILNLLSKHFGWEIPELSLPVKDEVSGIFRFIGHFFKRTKTDDIVGTVQYSNGKKANILVPKNMINPIYNLNIQSILNLQGLSIPSHRNIYNYSKIQNISTQRRSQREAFELAKNSYITQYSGGHSKSTNYFIKETLLGWAIAGKGNEFIQADNELIEHFLGFQKILYKVLPKNIGFKKISIRNFEIVFETDSGDFLIDSASGGISSIIDLCWQIFNYTIEKKEKIIVLIDEVENHLHPSMQREILNALTDAFDDAQFIVTTHSPLVVTSVRESNVYALKYNSERRVDSLKLDFANEIKTANEILNDVLGLNTTLPVWVEEKFAVIIKNFEKNEITNKTIEKLKQELNDIGLSKMFIKSLNDGLGKK